MHRVLLVCSCLVLVCGVAAAQGLSPRAGMVSDGLYTNLYFGLNYQLPADWVVSFVAMSGDCPQECLLLDARAPEANSNGGLTISAEPPTKAKGDEHVTLAALTLEQAGARRLAPVREVAVGGRTFYRADYRSAIVGGEVYHSVLMLPTQSHAVVFSFSARSRKQVEAPVGELPKALRFVGRGER